MENELFMCTRRLIDTSWVKVDDKVAVAGKTNKRESKKVPNQHAHCFLACHIYLPFNLPIRSVGKLYRTLSSWNAIVNGRPNVFS
jgi:hypothetical protein